ncbi:MAG TPA: response regulator [Candidatus Limnocylindrales bacterium]|nr:response regulator [Candidatus Limnocylindrales bacterium]
MEPRVSRHADRATLPAADPAWSRAGDGNGPTRRRRAPPGGVDAPGPVTPGDRGPRRRVARRSARPGRRYPIALLVTDLMMPGMNGIELAGKLRRFQPSVPVILVSMTPDAGILGIEPPAAFLAKPFSLRDLAAMAASLMASPKRVS